MKDNSIPTIKIPSIPYFSNIVIFPHPGNSTESRVFVLKKEADIPEASSKTLNLHHLPGHVYCLLPSREMYHGKLFMFKGRPNLLRQFNYCLEVDKKYIFVDNGDLQDPVADSVLAAKKFDSCKTCFVSHFPRPNTKICKGRKIISSRKKEFLYVRLRGGAKEGKG